MLSNGFQVDVAAMARAIRRHALRMTHAAKASHIGSGLSVADVLAVLYGRIARVEPTEPKHPDRDRVIVSKGHAAAVIYAALAERGFIPRDSLLGYSTDASLLCGHVSHKVPGVEVSTGSLGHGLPIGCGIAVGGCHAKAVFRVFVVLSDGELDEGSNWEALLFAGHHKLSNLVAIVDFNRIQSFGSVVDVLDLGDIAQKVRGVGWEVLEVDGHDLMALEKALGLAGPARASRSWSWRTRSRARAWASWRTSSSGTIAMSMRHNSRAPSMK